MARTSRRRGRGRPSKLTDETVEKLCKAIKLGATYQHACNYAGIDYSTFSKWMAQGEEASSGKFFDLFNAIKSAEGEAVAEWLEVIKRASDDGNWQASAWRLERRYPNDYARQQRHEVSGRDGQPLHIQLVWGDDGDEE